MTDTTTLDSTENEQPKKRPVFLTVLCILTWIGSGIGLLSGMVSFITGPADDYSELANTPDPSGMLDGIAPYEDFVMWSNVSNGIGILVAALCIVGAILMFKLNKIGFFLYLAGCIISVAVTAMAMNVLMPPMLAWVGVLTVVLGALISAAFIIMYAVNLKHMN